MKEQKSDILTAGSIAKQLAVPDARVKQIIKETGIKPAAKKGVCNYYSGDAIAKIKLLLKKT